MDNLEGVATQMVPAMTRWQQTDAQFLITSRIPLGLEAERLVRVEPLSASRGHPSPASALLLESVRRRGGRLDHSAKAADVVALLEGVPLAILIVAGQIERVGLDAIHDELVRGGSTLSALHQRVALVGAAGRGAARSRSPRRHV